MLRNHFQWCQGLNPSQLYSRPVVSPCIISLTIQKPQFINHKTPPGDIVQGSGHLQVFLLAQPCRPKYHHTLRHQHRATSQDGQGWQ